MEPERKVIKSNATAKLQSDRKDIGVCGTYRHRVININPLLLTPDSASKLYQQRSSENSDLFHSPAGYLPSDLLSLDDISIETASDDHASVGDIDLTAEVQSTESNIERNENNTDLFSPDENNCSNTEMNLQNQNSLKSSTKSPDSIIKTTPRRERVIEILPSLILPITSLPVKKDLIDVAIGRKDGGVRRNASTISTSSSITSLSDVQSLKTLDEQDFSSDVESSLSNVFDAQSKYDQLAQALKLADADMAILVSSKQQLQLEIHDKDEKLRILSRNFQEGLQKIHMYEKIVEDMKESTQRNEEKHESELLDLRRKNDEEIHTINNVLNVSNAERDSTKQELELMNQNLEAYTIKCEKVENEMKNLTARNISLEEILRKASAEGEGSKIFVDHLKQDNLELSKKLNETDQEYTMLKIKHKALETKLVDLQQSHSELSERAASHESRFRETDSNNATLSGHLRVATKEKQELNAAVQRLRLDLVKVESSFSRLKQQMIEKSRLAEQEAAKRLELEEKLNPFLKNEKVNNTSVETRIRDKNIQIEQLLSKSKSSTQEKITLENTIKELQSHIDRNEKSWNNAIEREKEYCRLLKEKEELLISESEEVETLSLNLSLEKQRVEETSRLVTSSKKEISELERKLKTAEATVHALYEKESSAITLRDENNIKMVSQHKEETTHLKNKIDSLENQVEVLQKALVSKEEELSRKSTSLENQEHDQHSFQQLQLLSELQSVRRQLSEEKDSLIEENKNLTASQSKIECRNEELLSELKTEKEMYQKRVAEMSAEAISTEQKLRDELTVLQQRCIELPAQTKVIKEERDVLKRELSNVMLQLANTSHTKEIEDLVEERDLLRNAVVQQQEYSKSLQKHYENWANEAAKKMKEEIMVARNSPKRQIIMENFYSQNSPNQRDTSEEIRKLKASAMEERSNFEAKKLQLTENIKKLEKLLSDRGGEVSTTTIATQTYEEIALYENLPQQDTSNKMPIANSNNDFLQHEDLLNESDSDLVLLTEEKFQLMQENTHQAELISELESRLQNWSSIGKPILEDSGTQTSHDDELLPFPTKISQLLEDSTTQTEHDNETVGHNEGETILKEKYLELQRENYVLRLEVQQLEKLGHDALNNQMLEDSGTQTDHDNYAATSHVSILLEDSSTQTDHDDELVGSFHQDMFVLQSREEDVVQLTVKLKEALQQNEALAAIISKHESNNTKAQSDVGTQTRHDDEPVRRFPNEADVLKTSVTDSSTQTDHDLEPLHSTQSVSYTGDSDTGQDIDVKHDMSSVCQSCRSAASNAPSNRPPSPMTILKTMESQKLKAYKNTVHILKRKLKRAEDTISNQQAELKVLMPVNSEDLTTAGTDNYDVSCNTSREADVAGKNGKSQEEISQMQREIYELKRTSALQAEEMRRKHLAGKKILEAKVLKLNERITRLTDTNELMRNSFDTLQVKLTEKKMALDIVQKEKNRFKTRARRLQASLRSLAWITGKQEKTLLAEIDDGVVDFSINESAEDSFGLENQSVYSTDSADGEHQCKENRFSISLPASVIDVEESLKDLQSEIVALEKQMQEHNTAVKKSKTQWGRLKEESTKELLPRDMSRSNENTQEVKEDLFSDVNTKIV